MDYREAAEFAAAVNIDTVVPVSLRYVRRQYRATWLLHQLPGGTSGPAGACAGPLWLFIRKAVGAVDSLQG